MGCLNFKNSAPLDFSIRVMPTTNCYPQKWRVNGEVMVLILYWHVNCICLSVIYLFNFYQVTQCHNVLLLFAQFDESFEGPLALQYLEFISMRWIFVIYCRGDYLVPNTVPWYGIIMFWNLDEIFCQICFDYILWMLNIAHLNLVHTVTFFFSRL